MSDVFVNWGRFYRRARWGELLAHATVPSEVALIAKDYLAAWHPNEIGALPPECRATTIANSDDVVEFARILSVQQFDPQQRSAELDRMAAFFVRASWRIAAIAGAMRAGPRSQPVAHRPH